MTGARLHMRVGTPPQPVTMVDAIDRAVDRLYQLRAVAANARRGHTQTEQLIDAVNDVGRGLCRAARG